MAKPSVHDPRAVDPRDAGPKPEYPQEPIAPPGSDAELTRQADHGEETYVGLDRLTDKVALVTGGDSGIGRAVAIEFAREGADVSIAYLPEEERDSQETLRWVEKAGRVGAALPGDITDEAHCERMIDETFTKALAQMAMKQGVRVNAVARRPVWTPLIASTLPETSVRTFGADTAFGHAAQPVELAPLFVFLASNEARFVTGEVYGATGGQTPY